MIPTKTTRKILQDCKSYSEAYGDVTWVSLDDLKREMDAVINHGNEREMNIYNFIFGNAEESGESVTTELITPMKTPVSSAPITKGGEKRVAVGESQDSVKSARPSPLASTPECVVGGAKQT